MGTRADFYVGRDPKTMEWLGSVAWDGHSDTMASDGLFDVSSEDAYRSWVASQDREDFTTPEEGWPWPWEDSTTTDYAYAWDDGKVWWSCFGREWQTDPAADTEGLVKNVAFPDMTTRQNVIRSGIKSGLITVAKSEKGYQVE